MIGKKIVLSALCAAGFLLAPASEAVTWNATVGKLQSTYDGLDCYFFTLTGVTQADPIKPGDPTFAIPFDQYGAQRAYAMLLAAKLADKQLTVVTRGTIKCGYAAVAEIIMQ
jgi:hypothetical protein